MNSTTITKSSGNVYADIGIPNPEEHAAKANLVMRMAEIIQREGLNQTEAARRMGLTQPDVSKILKGQFRPFSLERMLMMLRKLGQDVRIEVSEPKRRRRVGKLTVEAS